MLYSDNVSKICCYIELNTELILRESNSVYPASKFIKSLLVTTKMVIHLCYFIIRSFNYFIEAIFYIQYMNRCYYFVYSSYKQLYKKLSSYHNNKTKLLVKRGRKKKTFQIWCHVEFILCLLSIDDVSFKFSTRGLFEKYIHEKQMLSTDHYDV